MMKSSLYSKIASAETTVYDAYAFVVIVILILLIGIIMGGTIATLILLVSTM